jgi:Redoxin.
MGDFGSSDAGSNPAGAIIVVEHEMNGSLKLLIFWRYTCYESTKLIKYLSEKLINLEFDMVGIHIPRFSFEKDVANIKNFLKMLNLQVPVILDNNKTIWKSFGQPLIPSIIIVNKDEILFEHFGGNGYYWLENGIEDIERIYLNKNIIKHDFANRILLEFINNYVEHPMSVTPAIYFDMNKKIKLDGNFKKDKQCLVLESSDYVKIRFKGKRVDVVLEPISDYDIVDVEINGKPVATHMIGEDVTKDKTKSFVRVTLPRIYNIINGGWGEYLLKLTTHHGVKIYSIVFH